uniref:TIMELESS-interacting protein n=1 Tax=Macaca nemestrina TaxID=9545 RepID=A0A2K6BNF0_MACNE
MIDLLDYEHVEDETFPPFLPPASPERQDGEGAEPDKESASGALVPVPSKRAVKINISKLDAHRLISERGLPALRHVFDRAKFKGKSHEAEDLKMPIRHMEHWAHRQFPKLQFEDFIDRVEYLRNKKEIQTFGENNGHCVTAAVLDPFLTNSSESEMFASESSRSLTKEQQQRIERNKQPTSERRQEMIMLMNTPRVQTIEQVNTDEDQKEESNGLNKDILDNLCNDAPETQLDQSFKNVNFVLASRNVT